MNQYLNTSNSGMDESLLLFALSASANIILCENTLDMINSDEDFPIYYKLQRVADVMRYNFGCRPYAWPIYMKLAELGWDSSGNSLTATVLTHCGFYFCFSFHFL